MVLYRAAAAETQFLSEQQTATAVRDGLGGGFRGQRILVLVPDHTRSLPLPLLFRVLVDLLVDAKRLDFMVALGTHPALDDQHLESLLGISHEQRVTAYQNVGILNHDWTSPAAMQSLGCMEEDETRRIAGSNWHASLPRTVDIGINKAALECDRIVIVGPTFPHEVAGFSGGAKYLFPGIAGPEMIHGMHWLGALGGVVGTIGIKHTPVRCMIDAAAARLQTPITLIALVTEGAQVAGVFIGDAAEAWSAAADLSAQRHVVWCEHAYRQVLSCAPSMYDELWTAAKAMYKIEPAVEAGGEVIIYAPHLEVVSRAHGTRIFEVGYHILPYFLENWNRFNAVPRGVLAHSTHLRGSGHMEGAVEKPNVRVTLASRIPAEDCARLNLGYVDPARINIDDWKGREDEGILLVPRAGETLYSVKDRQPIH